MRIALVIAFFFLSGLLYSQEPVYKHFTTADGLPSNEVYHAFQDSKGYMWFATDNGVSRYDGYTFENFGLKDGILDNTVFEIYEDYKGRIWFVNQSNQFVYYFNGMLFQYKYNSKIKDRIEITNPIKGGFKIEADGGLICSNYISGAYKLDYGGCFDWQFYLSQKKLINIIDDGKEIIITHNAKNIDGLALLNMDNEMSTYIAYRGPRVLCCKMNKVILFSNENILYLLAGDHLSILHVFESPVIWLAEISDSSFSIGLLNRGLKKYNFTTHEIFEIGYYLKNLSATSFLHDNNGGEWITTLEDGVYYSTMKSNVYKSFIDGIRISSVIETDTCIYFGTNNKKIYRIYNSGIDSVIMPELKGAYYSCLAATNGLLYGNNSGYLYSVNISKKEIDIHDSFYLSNGKLRENRMIGPTAIVNVEDTLWVCGMDGNSLFWLKDDCLEKIPIEVPSGFRFNCMCSDGQKLYIGTMKGIYCFDRFSRELKYLNNIDLLLNTRINDVKWNNGLLYVATRNNGLFIISNMKLVARFDKISNGSSSAINNIYCNDSVILIGTRRGADILNHKEQKIDKYRHIKGVGLEGENIIFSVIKFNRFFFFSNRKIYTIFASNLNYMSDSKNTICMQRILVNNVPVKLDYLKNLSYYENSISLIYKELDYHNHFRTRFHVKVFNENKLIKEKTSFDTILKLNLQNEGFYNIEIFGDEKKNNSGSFKYPIIINPPLYKTGKFYIIVGIFSLIFGMIGMKVIYDSVMLQRRKKRFESKRRLNHEKGMAKNIDLLKQRILAQQMNPHFIFNTLNSIQYYIYNNKTLESSKYLAKFANLMRMALKNTQEFRIPLSDEIKFMEMYLELEALRLSNNLNYKFELDSSVDSSSIKVPTLIMQPFIENSILHGIMNKPDGVGDISIHLRADELNLFCRIRDNGVGRKKAAEIKAKKNSGHVSHGTKITDARLKLFSSVEEGSLTYFYSDITDHNKNVCGTEVLVCIPLITKTITKIKEYENYYHRR